MPTHTPRICAVPACGAVSQIRTPSSVGGIIYFPLCVTHASTHRICSQCSDSFTMHSPDHMAAFQEVCGPCISLYNYRTCSRCNQFAPVHSSGQCSHCVNRNGARGFHPFISPTYTEFAVGADTPLFPHNATMSVELEFGSARQISPKIAEFGYIKEDGSVATGLAYNGEFAMRPASGDKFLETLQGALGIMKVADAGVNHSCGMHLHVDVTALSDVQRARIFHYWRMFEPIFFALCEPRRVGSTYCRPISSVYNIRNAVSFCNRYGALNTTAFSKYGTFEFRLHHGTLDYKTIVNWTSLVNSFIHATKSLPLAVSKGGGPTWDTFLALTTRRDLLTAFLHLIKPRKSTATYVVRTIKPWLTTPHTALNMRGNHNFQLAAPQPA